MCLHTWGYLGNVYEFYQSNEEELLGKEEWVKESVSIHYLSLLSVSTKSRH